MNLAAVTIGACAIAACHDSPRVSGRACIVLDLRYPRQCLGGQDVAGLSVEEVGSARRSVTDADGSFRLETPDELTNVVLRLVPGRDDRRASIVAVDLVRDRDIVVPVIATSVWTSYITSMGGSDDPARASLHGAYDPPGSTLAGVSVASAGQLFYNQGSAFDWAATPPGDETIAFLALDLPAGTSAVSVIGLDDSTHSFGDLPLEANTITWLDLER